MPVITRASDRPLNRATFGDFSLTDAVRPSNALPVVPRAGYRRGRYHRLRTVTAAASSDQLFDLFLALLEPLGEVVDVILEGSHDNGGGQHRDLRRPYIDRPILESYCYEYEDLLLHDGCTGIAVLNPEQSLEVQFDEHKQLTVFARRTKPFRRILRRFGLREDAEMQFLSEAEHWHRSEPRRVEEFDQFCLRLGVGELDYSSQAEC